MFKQSVARFAPQRFTVSCGRAACLAVALLALQSTAQAQTNPITVTADNGLSCAGTRAGGTGSGCTAKDFTTIVNLTNPSVASCVHGQTITLSVVATIISASTRDDLGFFIGEQGNDPQVNDAGKTCSVAIFPKTPPPWFDDTSGSGSNACGDFNGGTPAGATAGTSDATINNITVICGPIAGQTLQIPYTLTYAVNPTACTSTANVNAVPNAKCQGGSASVPATVVTPGADVSMVKGIVISGNQITYTLLISNTGPDSADAATYDDMVPATVTLVGPPTCSVTSGAAVCATPNVSGNDVSGAVPTFPANSSVTITITGTATNGADVSNTASVAPPNGVTDPNPGNNTSTITGTALPVKLQNFDVK